MLKWIQTSIVKISAILILLLVISPQVKAELTAQLYGGTGFTQKHNASVNLPDANISGTHEALAFDSAAIVGGRGAYWIDALHYLGFGVDASHFFGPNQKDQISLTNLCVGSNPCSISPEHIKKFNNNITSIGFDVMLRYPLLTSTQFTKGRVQPYLTVGPALFISTLKDTDNFIPPGQSSTYTSLGVKAGGGLILFLTQRIGAFVEYRDSAFQVKDTYTNNTVVRGITLGKTLGKANFNIQSIVGGVAFRF